MTDLSIKLIKKRKKPKVKIKLMNLKISLAFLIIFLTFYSSAFAIELNQVQENKSLIQSVAFVMADVVREFYKTNNIKFDFVIYGHQTDHISDVIDAAMKELKMDTTINIKRVKDISNWNHNFNQSAVILTESKENFNNLQQTAIDTSVKKNLMLSNRFPKLFKFVVYTEEVSSLTEIQELIKNDTIINLYFPNLQFYQYFIINDEKLVNLAANLLYSEEKCGIFTQKLLNSFDKITQKWRTKLENLRLLTNFHGCLLNFVVSPGPQFYPNEIIENIIDINEVNESQVIIAHKKVNFAGLVKELVELMSKKSNFNVLYLLSVETFSEHGYNYAVVTQNFEPSAENALFIKDTVRDGFDFDNLHDLPYGEVDYYYLITLNDLYTNYEKLLFAFDTTTWIMLLMTYGLTFGIIAVLHMTSRRIKTIFFGRGINNPAYNALGIFFGVAQVRLPYESFCRSLWIFYIWFCLIIRTCYQSKMFEFMTSDMRKPLPETIEDLIQYDYTILILMADSNGPSDTNEQIINGRNSPTTLILPFDNFTVLYNNTLHKRSNMKCAFLVNSIIHTQLNSTLVDSLTIMKYERAVKIMAFHQGDNFILFHQLKYYMEQLIPSGIPMHLYEYGRWFLYRPFHVEFDNQPKVLTFEVLEFGFVLWLAACFLSILVYLCEIRRLWLRRKLRKLIGLINFLRVLKERLMDYHDRW